MVPDWAGQTVAVLASGPSLTAKDCNLVREAGAHTIAVNATFRLAPWADVVYMGDMMAVKTYLAEVPREKFWTQCPASAQRYQLNRIRGSNGVGLGKPGEINLGGNSGFQAVNLAYVFGARRILLLGFDMAPGPQGRKHWHEDHPAPCVQAQCFNEWKLKFKKLAEDLKVAKCEVVNCSRNTALECFNRGDLEEELSKCHTPT